MGGQYGFIAGQIGKRTRNAQNTVETARGKRQLFQHTRQHRLRFQAD